MRCSSSVRPVWLHGAARQETAANWSGRPWPWLLDSRAAFVPPNPVFVTDDPEAECEAVLAGIGFGQLPRHLAAPYLLDHRLMSVLEGLGPASTTMYVYRPQRTPVSARVRLVFDALCELLDDRAN